MSIPKNKEDLFIVARMNIIYHDEMANKYSKVINWTTFASILFSSSALIGLGELLPIGYNSIMIGASALIVAISNSALFAFEIQSKQRNHSENKRKWSELVADIQRVRNGDISEIIERMAIINSSEPPPDQKKLDRAHDFALHAEGKI